MPGATRDKQLQSLILGGTVIPLGGDGISARISMGDVGATTRGVATSIKTRPGQREGLLTITVYAEDPAEPILRGIYNRSRIVGGTLPPLPGVATNTAGGQSAKWADAHFRTVPDMTLGTDVEVGTYEIDLIDAEIDSTGAIRTP